MTTIQRSRVRYYECHITLEPVSGASLDFMSGIATQYGFKVADLLMKKGSDLEPSTLDCFMSGRSNDEDELTRRMAYLKSRLEDDGFVVRRYKIEAALLDSKCGDVVEYEPYRDSD